MIFYLEKHMKWFSLRNGRWCTLLRQHLNDAARSLVKRNNHDFEQVDTLEQELGN